MKPVMLKRLKLLHVVLIVGAALLALKAGGLFHDALAQENKPPAKPPSMNAVAAPRQPVAAIDPADADDADSTSAAEMDVLTSLSKRRAELDAREDDLVTRENLLKAAEQRVDAKIAQLASLQTQIQQLLGQRDAAQQKQIDSLVKTYTAMKPKDAARIFNVLDENVRLAVAQGMKPDVLGAILAQMKPDAAQAITVKLAQRLDLPNPGTPVPAQANGPLAGNAAPSAQAAPNGTGVAPSPADAPPIAASASAEAGPTTPASAAANPPAPASPTPAQALAAGSAPKTAP